MQVFCFIDGRFTKIQKIVSYCTSNFTGVDITFMNSESLFKTSSKINALLAAAFTGYQTSYVFGVTS